MYYRLSVLNNTFGSCSESNTAHLSVFKSNIWRR